jgi:hypothetical protein
MPGDSGTFSRLVESSGKRPELKGGSMCESLTQALLADGQRGGSSNAIRF